MSTQATKWQALVIITKSLIYSLYFCLVVIWRSLWGSCKREDVDRHEHVWADRVLAAVNVDYKIHNPYQVSFLPDHCYVVMSNHASLFDIPLIIASFPGSIRLIAKKELFKIPIWGRALKTAEFVFIDRNNRRQAWKDLAQAKEKMRSGIALWISPEGTRTRTGELSPFKKGGFVLAMQTGAMIIPVGLHNTSEILPPKTLKFRLGVKVDVFIGKPISVESLSKADYPSLMQRVEDEIRQLRDGPDRQM
jgi:1-acyl-sn-glycerol-3-phosphate acyltransferase